LTTRSINEYDDDVYYWAMNRCRTSTITGQ